MTNRIRCETWLTRDVLYDSLTIEAPLHANGWRVFVAGTLTVNRGGLIDARQTRFARLRNWINRR